jgi:uncharacterized protein YrrD
MPTPADLHAGANVYSSDGHKLGELQRVVLRRSDLTATHIVIDIGFLRAGHKLWEGGLGLEYDRVVPIDAVASASDDRLDLNLTALQFKDAPEYTTESFEDIDVTRTPYDPKSLTDHIQAVADRFGDPNNFLVQRFAEAPGSVDIAEGSPVWRVAPHDRLGEVDRVLFAADGKAQAFVIKRGSFLKRDVVLPIRYVTELLDDLVRVEISDADLEDLQTFHP